MRSFVKGDRGLRRYQVPQRIAQQDALQAMKKFLSGNMAIARNAARQSQISEMFLVHLPFWTVWGRVAGWAFGQKKVSSGKNTRYEPREIRLVQEMTWTGAACDVGEFGVTQLRLTDQELRAFDPDELHNTGMVFEPVNSFSDAQGLAETQFQEQIRQNANLERLSQLFTRSFKRRLGLVYYPLWVIRYLYRGRAFQVVVDGYSGKVLYGKAPGNTFYRAGALVLGMALGAFLAIDVNAGLMYLMNDSEDFPFLLFVGIFIAGLALMYTGWRRFRYGEQYEYRANVGKSKQLLAGLENPLEMIGGITNVKDIEQWINRFS
jgi:hypothetical protein